MCRKRFASSEVHPRLPKRSCSVGVLVVVPCKTNWCRPFFKADRDHGPPHGPLLFRLLLPDLLSIDAHRSRANFRENCNWYRSSVGESKYVSASSGWSTPGLSLASQLASLVSDTMAGSFSPSVNSMPSSKSLGSDAGHGIEAPPAATR